MFFERLVQETYTVIVYNTSYSNLLLCVYAQMNETFISDSLF
jgi:hypothetical protein